MTHLEGPAFLEDMHAAAKRYLSMLEGCITRTKELDDQEEAASVTEQVYFPLLKQLGLHSKLILRVQIYELSYVSSPSRPAVKA